MTPAPEGRTEEDLPKQEQTFPWRCEDERGFPGNVPVVLAGPLHEAIAMLPQVRMLGEVAELVLHEDELRAPAFEVEAAQHVELGAFHVDGEEVDRPEVSLTDDRVEGCHGDMEHALVAIAWMIHARNEARADIGSGDEERSQTLLTGSAHGLLEHARAGSAGAKHGGLLGERFHKDARPADLFEQPRLRAVDGIVGADLDEASVPAKTEVLPDEQGCTDLAA